VLFTVTQASNPVVAGFILRGASAPPYGSSLAAGHAPGESHESLLSRTSAITSSGARRLGIGHRLTIVRNRGVQNFAVVIHEDPEGGFWAEVPALPGCYSQGETVDELKHNIR
jgi:hypothetical protein